MNNKPYKYRFYATLLDSFEGYINSSQIWQQYWGNSDNPSKTEEEFEKEQFQSLIDRINRTPIPWEDKEKADLGTAFNEVVDCIILNQKSDKMQITSDKESRTITALYNNRTFIFPISVCVEFANYYKDAIPQVWTEGILPTKYGPVLLCGYIDELMTSSIHDIKTTGKYGVGKFRNNWQHRVYPYCLELQGNTISEFEYNIAQIDKYGRIETFTEQYFYRAERDVPLLQWQCEMLIEFLHYNRHLITDTKIFGLE